MTGFGTWCYVASMNGDANPTEATSPGVAPVPHGGQTGAENADGGPHDSAPVRLSPERWRALKERHDAAIHILKTQYTGTEERWALLAAVIAPESAELLEREEAA